jgi:hypothetical protein
MITSLIATLGQNISELIDQILEWDTPTVALAALVVAISNSIVTLFTFAYNVRTNRRRGRLIAASLHLLEDTKLKVAVTVRNLNSDSIQIENWYAVRHHRPPGDEESCAENIDTTTEAPPSFATGPEVPFTLPGFASELWEFPIDPPEDGTWYNLRVIIETGVGDRIATNEIHLPLDFVDRLTLRKARQRDSKYPRRRSLLRP